MSNSRRKIGIGSILLSLVLLGGVGTSIFFGITAAWGFLKTLQPPVAAAIIASSGTILVSVFTLLVSKLIERKNAIRLQIREKKIPAYEELISTSFKVLYSDKLEGKPMEEKEMLRLLVGATERLVIWGSDEVLLAYRAFRRYSEQPESSAEILFLWERLMLEIRKDLGHQNVGFERGSLLSLWITDIDRVIASAKVTPKIAP
ncbi:MAG TPA: hypothetical protein VFJ16_16005 [Longimicrobium sp.]|nr:hypothetical protein [Longimicrobium sp.]